MTIKKLLVKNYKLLKDVCVHVNPDVNVFVGENDAGKSTLLEVVSIITSGKLNGYSFAKQLKVSMFSCEVRQQYISSLSSSPIPLPKIIMEAYCDSADVRYQGCNNELKVNSCGIRVAVEFDNRYDKHYQELITHNEIKDIPLEFYRVDINYFSGDPVCYKTFPMKSFLVDATRKDYSGIVDRFVSDNISEYLSESEQIDLVTAYRQMRQEFQKSEIVKTLNNKLRTTPNGVRDDISFQLKENNLDEWKRQMEISVSEIPFDQIGFGSQNVIKIELALKAGSKDVNVLLLEEPENCLSHTNLAKLFHKVASLVGKQVFVSTHSSFIANKLNLSNLLFVNNGRICSFKELPIDTVKYFNKLPGYDTLRLILAEKVILVEGPTDDLIIQRAFKDQYGKLPVEMGIDIIVVGSLAFKRFCDIAQLVKKDVAIVTDNDGDVKTNIQDKYSEYLKSGLIHFYYEKENELNTIEPSVLNVNCIDISHVSESFLNVISKSNSLKGADRKRILDFMTKNKTEWAMRVFDAENRIQFPQYIKDLVNEYR